MAVPVPEGRRCVSSLNDAFSLGFQYNPRHRRRVGSRDALHDAYYGEAMVLKEALSSDR